jgi:hypothetical protein
MNGITEKLNMIYCYKVIQEVNLTRTGNTVVCLLSKKITAVATTTTITVIYELMAHSQHS